MRSVLITGAGRGFGRALAEVFSTKAWRVFPLVRRPDIARELCASLVNRCHPIVADVEHETAAGAIARTLTENTESLDLLINNAGHIKKTTGVLNMTPEDLERHFRVHCVGAFRCTKAAVPFLAEAERPAVVNITSRRGSMAVNQSESYERGHAYMIAKCAQNMLTICLDRELRQRGIRVFALHPGRLTTGIAPPDADTSPLQAASRFADWIETIDRNAECACFDLMADSTIPW
jgi:NAD(P)-dependent dehydrogenase (short-subunit alcohol dehydrogenase family)